jgi:type VI secretion system protein ImpJ
MERLRPVFWGQGMFLQPQHFQQQDAYHEGRLRQLFHFFLPHCWGVKSLTVNESALRNFIFEVEQCDLVTWDGTLLRFRGESAPSNARIEPRSFEQHLDPTGRPLNVYVGLRRIQLEESNLDEHPGVDGGQAAQQNGRRHKRFLLQESEMPDLCTGERQTCVLHQLIYEPYILFDVPASRSEDYELVKIAEILRSPDGKGGVLSRRYIPPSVGISSSPILESILKEIRDLLTVKGQELAEYRRRHGGNIAELGARYIGHAFLTQTVNRYVPIFHHYIESGEVHPYLAYGTLRQLVGELSTFSETVSVLGARAGEDVLPPYRHDQLWPCFHLASSRVKDLLSEMTTGNIGDVILHHDGEFFSASIDPQFLAGDNRYYLAIKTDVPPAQLFRLLQDTGKITSREEMPKLQKSFLFGLKIDVLESPPEELLMRAHYRYFLIDHRSEHWQKIQQTQNIAAYCPSLPPETEIRLVVIYGQ